MSLSEMVAQLESELTALSQQETQLLGELAELEQGAVSIPAEITDRLHQALTKLKIDEPVAAPYNGHNKALAKAADAATPHNGHNKALAKAADAAAPHNGHNKALAKAADAAAPPALSVLVDTTPVVLPPEELLFDNEALKQPKIPDWMHNPEELMKETDVVNGEPPTGGDPPTGLDWLDEMADGEAEFQEKAALSGDDLIKSFLLEEGRADAPEN